MTLTLKITSFQSQALGPDSSKEFAEGGGSIGRDPANDWALPDPERYISGRHALITHQNNSFYLTDISTNGVFVNGSSTSLGDGNRVELHDGDRLSLGDYEIEVSLDDGVAAEPFPPLDAFSSHFNDDGDPGIADPTNPTGHMDLPESLDPLAFATPPSAVPEFGAEPDHTPSLAESFQVPEATPEQIPDDWDMTGLSISDDLQRPVPPPGPAPAAPRPTPPPTVPPVSTSTSQSDVPPAVSPPQMVSDELSAAFLRGVGIGSAGGLSPLESVEAMESYGQLFREVVQGMMEVLMARAALKSEFRVPLTTIRPVGNNPLKFSPSVDEALKLLFSSQSAGYLSPVESIREGFEDIKCHQMAMVAGMQAAFRYMLQRFDPESFQEKDKGGVFAKVPISHSSRNWDNYCEYFKKITGDTDQSFQTLFGREFSRAYEEQIQRLMALRRK